MQNNKDSEVILKIHETISWLENYGGSQDIEGIALKQQELATNAFWFSESVSEAYAERNKAKAHYEAQVARSVAESTLSAAKAERIAELAFEPSAKEYVDWDNLYNRLSLKLKAIDRVLDNTRQRVSVIKQMELKHPGGGI